MIQLCHDFVMFQEELEDASPSHEVFDALSSKVLAVMPLEELEEKVLAKLSAQVTSSRNYFHCLLWDKYSTVVGHWIVGE